MRYLITGIAGFAGRNLVQRLAGDGHEVFGTTRGLQAGREREYPSCALPQPDHLFVVGLSETARLSAIVRDVRPDGLFHLAAFTSPSASFADPAEAYRANLHGSLNVFGAVRAADVGCRIVWVGSSDVYGQVNENELPVTEHQLLRPLSPYAVSKAAADLAAYQWSRAHGLDIVRLRPFNHTGPGQDPQFVCSDFVRQVVLVEKGQAPPRIEVGNLEVTRDFSDVRDIVAAYALACHRGEAGEAYNVCSGIPRTMREVLETVIRLSGVEAEIAVQPQRQRRIDVHRLVGSANKLRTATGWAPAIAWEQTLCDLVDDWRQRLR